MIDKEILDLIDHYQNFGWTFCKVSETNPWIIDGNFGSVEAPTIREAVIKAIMKQAEWATTKPIKPPVNPGDCPNCGTPASPGAFRCGWCGFIL